MPTEDARIRNVASKGYVITSFSPTLTKDELMVIRAQGLPVGDGWSPYIGLRFVRSFLVSQSKIAIAWIEVVDKKDEFGRSPIFESDVTVVHRDSYRARLELLITQTGVSEDSVSITSKETIRSLYKESQRIIFVAPFKSAKLWQKVNAIIINTVLNLNDNSNKLSSLSFASFSLQVDQDKSTMLVLPHTKQYLSRNAIKLDY